MSDVAVELSNVSKMYRVYRSSLDRLKDWISLGRKKRYKEFWALKDINLEVEKGTMLGIVGQNGAGKSTLLSIISGITAPTTGSVEVNGRVSALLELGIGFHPELTGRKNVLLNGRMLGLSREELEERLPEIVAFSELGEFIDRPLRTYSSGMYVRLGFSMAINIDPEILIIDEVLAVGDAYFQQKCVRKIRELKDNGITILFVSHDAAAVRMLCDEAVLVDEGRIIDRGNPMDVLDHYNGLIAKKAIRNEHFIIEKKRVGGVNSYRSGNFYAVVKDVKLLDENGDVLHNVTTGQRVRLVAHIVFWQDVKDPTVGFSIRDRFGNNVFGTNSYHLKKFFGEVKRGEEITVEYEFDMNVGVGLYTISVTVHLLDVHLFGTFFWGDNLLSFSVLPDPDYSFVGVARVDAALHASRKALSFDEFISYLREFYADAPDSIDVGSEQVDKFLLYGVYGLEDWEGISFKWSKERFEFVLRVSPEHTKLRFVLRGGKPDIGDAPTEADVFCDGRFIGSFRLSEDRWVDVGIGLPDWVSGEIRDFDVKIKNPWKASDYGLEDSRVLGVAISKIYLE